MLRAAVLAGAFIALPVVAQAQQPCTKDAHRVVGAIYQRILERPYDPGGIGWINQLRQGKNTVRELVRDIAKSPEYAQKFLSGDRQAGVTTIYRHLLDREPDPDGLAANIASAERFGWPTVIDGIVNSREYSQGPGEMTVPGTTTRYCGSTTSPFRRTTQMRFPEMDGNKDGTITRAEWRGSRQSFNVHDWNADGVLSGEEVRVGGQRPGSEFDFDPEAPGSPAWNTATFNAVDRNRDGRILASEWYFDTESFIRADRNRDGVLTRAEFFAEDNMDDDRGDSFADLDANTNGRVERSEWHASADAFTWLDRDSDGVLSRAEVVGEAAARDQFVSLDTNRDNLLRIDEWPWSQRSFTQQDTNRDGMLTRQEFLRAPRAAATPAR